MASAPPEQEGEHDEVSRPRGVACKPGGERTGPPALERMVEVFDAQAAPVAQTATAVLQPVTAVAARELGWARANDAESRANGSSHGKPGCVIGTRRGTEIAVVGLHDV